MVQEPIVGFYVAAAGLCLWAGMYLRVGWGIYSKCLREIDYLKKWDLFRFFLSFVAVLLTAGVMLVIGAWLFIDHGLIERLMFEFGRDWLDWWLNSATGRFLERIVNHWF